MDLQLKIILGDKSDNIERCFPKCGTKTALKYIADPTSLEAAFEKYPGSRELYHRNSLIIDFKRIPDDIQDEIKSVLDELKF